MQGEVRPPAASAELASPRANLAAGVLQALLGYGLVLTIMTHSAYSALAVPQGATQDCCCSTGRAPCTWARTWTIPATNLGKLM